MFVSFSVSRKAKQVAHSCITHCCFCFRSKFGHPELSGSEFCSVAPCLLKTWLYLYFFHKGETSDTQHAFMCYEDSKCVFFLCVPFTEKPQNYKTWQWVPQSSSEDHTHKTQKPELWELKYNNHAYGTEWPKFTLQLLSPRVFWIERNIETGF